MGYTYRLIDLVNSGRLVLNDGYRTKRSELGRPGIPILRVAEVQDGYIAPSLGDHIREEFRQKIGSKCSKPGDVIVTTKGTVGRVAQLGNDDPQFAYSPQVCFFRALPGSEINSRWLYYWFRSPQFRAQAGGVQSQTDMADYINLADMRAIKITLPGKAEQETIAVTLGALDDKIEANRRLIELIPKLIEAEIAAIDSIEWQSVAVSSLARFVNGGAYTKGATGVGKMVVRIAELNSGPGKATVYNDLDVHDDKLARSGDLLMSWSGSLGLYRWTREEAIINQHIFKVIPESYPPWLVHNRLQRVMSIFHKIAKDKATTMGHIQRGHLDRTMIDVPPADAIDLLDEALSPLWMRLLVAEREMLKLAAFRDTLLPGLLSGRLRAPEVREVAEAVI